VSGHSHYSTIKRAKEAKDAQKGRIFSKMARAISIAVKSGGSTDPAANYKLRMVIEEARSYNMPKENIERAIMRAGTEAEAIEEVKYEGYGPAGIAVIVEATTDNRNRTGQEIKNIFERAGGSLAGPGSVSFNFETKGLAVVKKEANVQNQILKLIDLGIEDFQEENDSIEVYINPENISQTRDKLEAQNFEIISAGIVEKPKNYQTVSGAREAEHALDFLEKLEEQEDVQKVFTNLDIPDDLGVKA
jgi:YebC/PmpR family DNA-binding regulatory protein